eukprot:TRINITY_DN5457_c0_g1_i1.p1 TRINITY_DN5457_c0_g1~~TRINITY_DN5457_c0_g1_i1.p1  ORF type:complete len:396 (-),score=64.73 TRINITY_DN5457_c0_g1_i1:72-1259(-)
MSRPTDRYPDPGVFDETLYRNLTSLPNGVTLDLQFLQKIINPEIKNWRIPKETVLRGMQANMFIIEVDSGDSSVTSRYMAKRINPKELPDKASKEIWQEFVQSVRKETDFYKEVMKAENQNIRCLFPKVYYSDGTPKELDSEPQETSFILIMEDLTENYYQTPMMSREQAESVMQSLARLHAHFWNQDRSQERGGFWVLERRLKRNEIENAEETWKRFLERFPEVDALDPNIKNIGKRIRERARDLDNEVEQGACTIIHGDAKGWNLFFSKKSNQVLLIDLQWTGRGHPFQDVAYALTTTLCAEELPNMNTHVDFYVDSLKCELAKKGVQLDPGIRGTFDNVWTDYARVIVTGLWKNLSKNSIEKNKVKVGPSMINRSIEHVFYITKRLARLLHV